MEQVEHLLAALITEWKVDLYARCALRGADLLPVTVQAPDSIDVDRLLATDEVLDDARRAVETGTMVVATVTANAGETAAGELVFAPFQDGAERGSLIIFGAFASGSLASPTLRMLEELARVIQAYTTESEQGVRQLRRLVVQLTEAEDRERSRIAMLLHDDLQQVLAGVKVHVDMAIRRAVDDQYVTDRLTTARALLDDAIERSRSLSRELNPPSLQARGLVPALHVLAGETERTHRLHVTVEAPENTPPVSDFAGLVVYRAVQELLFNIIKHAGVKEASIQVNVGDDGLRIAVRDHGAGFDVDSVIRNDSPSGLGLISVRERLEAIGATLEIHSLPGAGSTFTIHLTPDAMRAEGTLAGSGSRYDGRSLLDRKLSILLVDDHAVIRQGLVVLLNDEPDLEVVGEASDGREAVDLARTLRPDVVVMDMTMPELAGDEATRRILSAVPQTRVIGLSMHTEREVEERMLDAGAVAYLSKAGPSSELVRTIRELA